MSIFLRIGLGYLTVLKQIAQFILIGSGILVVCAVLVLPFWFLAEHYPHLFNFVFFTIFLFISGYFIFRRIRHRKQQFADSPGKGLFLVQILKRFSLSLLFLFFVFCQLYFYTGGYLLPGIGCSIVFLFIFGTVFFKTKPDNSYGEKR